MADGRAPTTTTPTRAEARPARVTKQELHGTGEYSGATLQTTANAVTRRRGLPTVGRSQQRQRHNCLNLRREIRS